MKTPRFLAAAGALAGAVVLGLAWTAGPVAHGQVFVPNDDRDVVRRIEVLGGRGASIGVTVRDLEESDVAKNKLTSPKGALVVEVDEDSPASTAGFHEGDVVVSFDGEVVRSARQFARLVDETPAGHTIAATVVRAGARVELEVVPSEESGRMRFGFRRGLEGEPGPRWEMRVPPPVPSRPDFEWMPDMRMEIDRALGRAVLGVGVQEMTPELGEYFGAKEGVLVNSVRPDSAAAKAGVKAGDVITKVDGQQVTSPGELRRRLRESQAGEITLGVVRDKKEMSLKATIDKGEGSRERRRWPV